MHGSGYIIGGEAGQFQSLEGGMWCFDVLRFVCLPRHPGDAFPGISTRSTTYIQNRESMLQCAVPEPLASQDSGSEVFLGGGSLFIIA